MPQRLTDLFACSSCLSCEPEKQNSDFYMCNFHLAVCWSVGWLVGGWFLGRSDGLSILIPKRAEVTLPCSYRSTITFSFPFFLSFSLFIFNYPFLYLNPYQHHRTILLVELYLKQCVLHHSDPHVHRRNLRLDAGQRFPN